MERRNVDYNCIAISELSFEVISLNNCHGCPPTDHIAVARLLETNRGMHCDVPTGLTLIYLSPQVPNKMAPRQFSRTQVFLFWPSPAPLNLGSGPSRADH